MKTTILITITITMFFANPRIPSEFGTSTGTKFPGCTTHKGPTEISGCTIRCDNGFIGSCVSNSTSDWHCSWINADGSSGHGSGTGSYPCNW